MKICVIGCGLRTPLLLHGILHSGLPLERIVLLDTEPSHATLMASLGKEMAGETPVEITAAPGAEQAIARSDFVISSIRVGNMETRAADERLSMECGFAGQETTGPAGFAMALRTVPAAIEYAQIVERVSPEAWIINFTNPAGLITQAISTYTRARVVGICDTPAELFLQIARALGEAPEAVRCEYFGLNHLGWVRSVRVHGIEVIDKLLADDHLPARLYPVGLFPIDLMRSLRLIPTEYLFYYYNQSLAVTNQRKAAVTRGEELRVMNRGILAELETCVNGGKPEAALNTYRRYLNRRNASYMKLDGAAESAFNIPDPQWDPFEGATGYHRIAVDVMRALTSVSPHSLILNTPNHGAIEGIAWEDIVEVPSLVDREGPRPLAVGPIPEPVRGLIYSVKEYERLAIQAAVERRWDIAMYAMTLNPIVGSWNSASGFLRRLADSDSQHFSSYKRADILRSAIG